MLEWRRAIVEVRGGPAAFTKVSIEPGRTLRVGRTNRADLVVGHDREMSGVHFALTWDGDVCTLRDLQSVAGTFIDGNRVEEVIVANGTWVRAGTTSFMVYLEGETPPRGSRPGEQRRLSPVQEMALNALRAAPTGPALLFVVLDASRDPRVLELVRESVEEHRSLYDGVQGEALAEVAPYLVSLPRGSALLERLVAEGWGKGWSVYLTSRHPFVEVRRHLRRFLMVQAEETGEKLYFRFYDPAVLRVFLAECKLRQREQFFDAVDGFWMEAEDGVPIAMGTSPSNPSSGMLAHVAAGGGAS